MNENTATVGGIVQVKPNAGTLFDGCLIVIEEVKSWGCVGYVIAPKKDRKQRGVRMARVRLSWPLVENTGGNVVWKVK